MTLVWEPPPSNTSAPQLSSTQLHPNEETPPEGSTLLLSPWFENRDTSRAHRPGGICHDDRLSPLRSRSRGRARLRNSRRRLQRGGAAATIQCNRRYRPAKRFASRVGFGCTCAIFHAPPARFRPSHSGGYTHLITVQLLRPLLSDSLRGVFDGWAPPGTPNGVADPALLAASAELGASQRT